MEMEEQKLVAIIDLIARERDGGLFKERELQFVDDGVGIDGILCIYKVVLLKRYRFKRIIH